MALVVPHNPSLPIGMSVTSTEVSVSTRQTTSTDVENFYSGIGAPEVPIDVDQLDETVVALATP